MVDCEYHGFSERAMASPDLADQISGSQRTLKFEVFQLTYEYNGEPVEVFHLSKEFSEKFNIVEFNSVPLPDDCPKWSGLLECVCLTCLESLIDKLA